MRYAEELSRNTRRNLKYSVGDAGSFGAMVGLGETYLPAFALAVGMGEANAGLVASLPVVAGGFMQLISLKAMRFFGDEQRWVVICATVQALAFIPLIAAAFYGTISMPMLLLIATLYWGSGLASGPAWNTWMESIVPSSIRARYFSRRSRFQQSATLIALVCSGAILHWAKSGDWLLIGFATVFIGASLSRAISVWCLARHHTNPRLLQRSRERSTTATSSSMTRKGRRLLAYLITVQACVQISGPFFAPYMLEQLKFSYGQYVFLMSVAFLSRIIAITRWSSVTDRFGAPTLLWIGAIGLIPLPTLWVVSSSIWWLAIAQICSGIAWAAYELGFFLLFFETLPPNRRMKMLTYYNLGNTTAMFVGASFGAAMLSYLGCTPKAYFTLFAISSVGRVLALGLLLRTKLKPVPIHALAVRVLGIRVSAAPLDMPILSSLSESDAADDESADD
ncbi:MAG: MFS transporter [Pirellulaceae bacterium]